MPDADHDLLLRVLGDVEWLKRLLFPIYPLIGGLYLMGWKKLMTEGATVKTRIGFFLVTFAAILCFLSPALCWAQNSPTVSLSQTALFGAVSLLSLGLTQLWKTKIAPKVSTKTAPWVAAGLGVAGAFITGLGQGSNIGQIGLGLLAGSAANHTYNLSDSLMIGVSALYNKLAKTTPPKPAPPLPGTPSGF